ncbi:hypothetical protein ACHRV5_00865 [Flavobacterium sp. FlaQc-52]|uniref:hypothetical protein n=1 Tax=Flavobacterium sp. FlaQc-52 TaxID=3374185 RepID=UPI00375685CD
MKKEQIGYSRTSYGKSLIELGKGDWKKSWIVIGRDDMDDPIFIDYERPNFPVFISEHGEDDWIETYIAISLENFSLILKDLEVLSNERKNPISEIELNSFFTKTKNKEMDIDYWKNFLDND